MLWTAIGKSFPLAKVNSSYDMTIAAYVASKNVCGMLKFFYNIGQLYIHMPNFIAGRCIFMCDMQNLLCTVFSFILDVCCMHL